MLLLWRLLVLTVAGVVTIFIPAFLFPVLLAPTIIPLLHSYARTYRFSDKFLIGIF